MVKCTEVLLKFIERGLPNLEIPAAQITGAVAIEIDTSLHFLKLNCVDKEGRRVRQICFRLETLREYECKGIVWEPIKESSTTLPGANYRCSALGCLTPRDPNHVHAIMENKFQKGANRA